MAQSFRSWTVCMLGVLLISTGLRIDILATGGIGGEAEESGPIISLPGHTGAVMCIAFSPNGKLAVTHGGLGDHAVHLWDIGGKKQASKLAHEECGALSVLWVAGGKAILSGGDGGRGSGAVILQDVFTGKRVGNVISHDSPVRSVALAPDGKIFSSADGQGTVRIIDLLKGVKLREFAHGKGVNSVAFSPDGKSLVTGCDDQALRIWSVEKDSLEKLLKGHTAAVGCVAYSPDGRKVYSASFSLLGDTDGTIRIWEAATGKELHKLEVGSEGRALTTAAFFADGRRALTGHGNGEVCLWDLGAMKKLMVFSKHKHAIQSVAFSPDGRLALSGENCQGGSEMWLYRLPRP